MPKRDSMQISTRAFASKTLDQDKRTMQVTAATETPARVWDNERMDVVSEILLASGFRAPKQTVVLDSHDRNSIQNVLGSARGFAREDGGQVASEISFANNEDGQRAMELYRDGHLTDVSVGYTVDEREWVEDGKKKKIKDREYVGPVSIVKKWSIREISLVAIGADQNAKSRSEIEEPTTNEPTAQARADENKQEGRTMPETTTTTTITPAPAPTPPAVDLDAMRKKVQEEATRDANERSAEILAACKLCKVDDAAGRLIASGMTLDQARAAILEEVGKRQTVEIKQRIEPVVEEFDKVRAAATDAISLRAGLPVAKPAAGAEEFRGFRLLRMFEELARRSGVNTRHMSDHDIAGMALGFKVRGAYPIVGAAADFPQILVDAANVSIQKMYQEAPHIWRFIARATSVPDFRTNYRAQLSEAPDLALIAENGEYTEAKFNDTYESYAIATYGKRFTISRKAIIDDNIGAFTRIPGALGMAAGRLIEQTVIGILTANANMSDSAALFVAGHSNLFTGAAFSATTIGTIMNGMLVQKGPGDNTAVVGAPLKYLLVPAALAFAAEIACASAVYPVPDTTMNSGAVNPVQRQGIIPLVCPLLDANSLTYHYGFADANAYDTIEVGFLNGQQTPMLEEVDQNDVDGRIFKVRMDVGAKALDWRYMARHNGA